MPISVVRSAGVTQPAELSGVLKRGSRGASVQQLQEKLNALGFDCGTADGAFGARTEAAVIAFQRSQSAVVGAADGKVGPKTWGALFTQPDAPTPSPATPPTDGFDTHRTLRRIKQSEVTPDITRHAIEVRNQYARPANYGKEFPFTSGGKEYVARIEQHYHPPGGPMKPWGSHAGVSILAVVE